MNKIISLFLLTLVFISCREKDICEQSCSGCLDLNIPYFSTTECKHYLKGEFEVLSTKLLEVIDNRTYGTSCSNFPPGEIQLIFQTVLNNVKHIDTLTTPGCQTSIIPTPGGLSLGTIEIGDNYQYKLLKVYPLSVTLGGGQNVPRQNEYDVLGVLKIN